MNTNSRLEEVDFIKGFAIASVILLHTLSAEIRDSLFSIFHIGQAVPIFIATTFFLSFISIQKAEKRILANWYSKKRLYNMLKRIVLPVLVINVLQIIVMLLFKRNDLITRILFGGATDQVHTIYGFTFNCGYLCRFYTV